MYLPAFPLAFVGLMAGLLLWSRIVYISYGIYSAVAKIDLRTRLRDPSAHQILVVLWTLVVASCVWALGFGTLAFHFGSTAALGWAWFFGGVAATPALVAVTTTRALRRLKKARAAGAQP